MRTIRFYLLVITLSVVLAACKKKKDDPTPVPEATSGTFIDSRDNQEYGWVKIGTQTWMSENLDYAVANSYYYNKSSSNSIYGRYYSWASIMNGASSSNAVPSGVQGLCPNGWHLPSMLEYNELKNYLSQNSLGYSDLMNETNNYWPIGGTNSTGFNLLPSGRVFNNGNSSNYLGTEGMLYTSTSVLTSSAVAFDNNSFPNVSNDTFLPCRCVKD